MTENGAKAELEIELKYYEGRPVIERLQRISRSGLRQYRGKDALPKVPNGLGIAIISTSKGIMTDSQTRQQAVGGDSLCRSHESRVGIACVRVCRLWWLAEL